MEILIVAVTGVLCIACFFIGAKTGQTVSKGKDIEVPNINPVKLYREHVERQEADKEREKLDAIMHNIEVYDGTSTGQKDVPS